MLIYNSQYGSMDIETKRWLLLEYRWKNFRPQLQNSYYHLVKWLKTIFLKPWSVSKGDILFYKTPSVTHRKRTFWTVLFYLRQGPSSPCIFAWLSVNVVLLPASNVPYSILQTRKLWLWTEPMFSMNKCGDPPVFFKTPNCPFIPASTRKPFFVEQVLTFYYLLMAASNNRGRMFCWKV